MPASNTATLTTPAPLDAPLAPAAEAQSIAIPAFYRTLAHLRAHWLNHRRAAEVALVATFLLLAAATFIAAR